MVSVSVVMPTYNTEVSTLKEAVDSILCQTFKDFEFIIIVLAAISWRKWKW